MILDCHIHMTGNADSPEKFLQDLSAAGVDGGIVLSYYPPGFRGEKAEIGDSKKRLKQLMEFTAENPTLYPYHFIDPLEPDVLEQIDAAVAAGVSGFKAICSHYYPQDELPMRAWTRIGSHKMPLLLHSGILYNNSPSANYNRPGNFEHLFHIEGLRFCLAHVSWPWCDELIAVFGKWNSRKSPNKQGFPAEMYIDLTPGTPPIYRKEVLTKLLTVGYKHLPRRMVFGTDAKSAYDSEHVKSIIERDSAIYDELGVPSDVRDGIFSGNLLNFIKN